MRNVSSRRTRPIPSFIARDSYDNPKKYLAAMPDLALAVPGSRKSSYTQVVDARILVVEDDLTVAEVVVNYLRRAGLEPRHALDGQTALDTAATWRADLG